MIWMDASTPIPFSTTSPTTNGPSPQHLQQIATARELAKPLRKAARYAVIDGWGLAIFGAITILTGLTSFPTLMIGCAMCVAAHFEFRGSSQLRRLKPSSINMLMWNQLVLGSALFLYALWSLITSLTGPSALAQAAGGDAALAGMLAPVESLTRLITTTVYVALMLVAIFVQGGTALFYRSRAPHLARYLEQAPHWIANLQRDGMDV